MKTRTPLLLFLLLIPMLYVSAQDDKGKGLDAYVAGERFRKAKDYQKAYAAYTKAIEAEPNNTRYHYDRCKCFYDAQRFDKAVECFEKVIELDPTYFANYEILAQIKSLQDQPVDAVKYYDMAFAASDDEGQKFAYKFQIIDLLLRNGRLLDTGPHIQQAKELIPGSDDLNYLDARYHNAIGEYEKALEFITPIVEEFDGEEDEGYAKFYYEQGYAYHMLNQYAEAKVALDKAKYGNFVDQVHKLSPEYYLQIAEGYRRVYEFEKAYTVVQKVLEMDPENAQAPEVSKALSIDSNDSTMRFMELRLKTYFKNKEDNEARKDGRSDRPILSEKELTKLYYSLCISNFKYKNYDAALLDANEYLSRNPANTLVIFYRAMSLFKLGSYNDAEGILYDLANTPQVKPEARVMSHLALGMIRSKTKQYELARGSLNKAAQGIFRPVALYELQNINLLLKEDSRE
ncbi:MAG: tetratricopeptide repeat protein [Bernardetiaceae bacterium]